MSARTVNISVRNWPILIIFGTQHQEKKLDANEFSFGHLTLILSLHYLVKCRSRSLAVYNNEFLLGSAIGSEMINWMATNRTGNYCFSKSHTCHIPSSLLQHCVVLLQHKHKR